MFKNAFTAYCKTKAKVIFMMRLQRLFSQCHSNLLSTLDVVHIGKKNTLGITEIKVKIIVQLFNHKPGKHCTSFRLAPSVLYNIPTNLVTSKCFYFRLLQTMKNKYPRGNKFCFKGVVYSVYALFYRYS